MSNKNKQPETPVTTSNGISTSVLALSVVISLLVGLIGGYFFGESRTAKQYEARISAGVYNKDSSQGNNNVTPDPTTSENPYAGDYTQFKINDTETVQSYYTDDETRYYASQLIGNALPDFKWTDSAGVEHSTAEYSEGRYILEFFSSTCAYCNNSASEVDKYRESSGNTVISLCFDTGDLSNFNQTGEHAWTLKNQSDADAQEILNFIPWIPCFMYVEDGTVRLVSYGGTTEAQIASEWSVAFGD